MTCNRYYKMEAHVTNKYQKDRGFKVCSECAMEEHTWQDCKTEHKKYLNFHVPPRTLAHKCPNREEIVNMKKQTNANQPKNYAVATTEPTTI